ncbi:MAG TPA: glycine zipper domain-containing protein [Gemmataceae bacterium]|nr:glycine zipper domain-containing protein [Gemmataceae bacterium]
MRTKRIFATVVMVGGLASAGCATKTGTGALAGGGIGAGLGALVGSATGNAGAGAAIGGALGAGTGAVVGSAADSDDRERREIRQATAVAQAQAQQGRMGITDVVSMVQHGHSETVIINQIRSSGSTFQLSAADLDYLKSANVPDRVVIEMQNARAAGPVIVNPPRGVVYADPPPLVVYERRPPPVVFVGPPPPPRPYVFVSGGYRHRW